MSQYQSKHEEEAASQEEIKEENKPQKKLSFLQFKGKDKKLLIKLAAIVSVGIVLMIISSSWSTSGEEEAVQEEASQSQSGGYRLSEEDIEQSLEEALSKISGAGLVDVTVTFSQSSQKEYAINTEETISQNTEIQEGEQGSQDLVKEIEDVSTKNSLAMENDNAVVVTETMPKLQGVLVVAQGADNSNVKNQLYLATEGLLGLPAHRIVIVDGE